MFLGAIADDVTGGTDLAGLLGRAGLAVVQTFDAPDRIPRADAVVVSLKIRTAPAQAATAAAATACTALASAGAEQIYFKYCSTFDSTDEGNIGPVIDTLLDTLGADFTIACPSYPEGLAHGVSWASVRWQLAAVRLLHAVPSADAHDRFQPRKRARTADAVARGTGGSRHD
jgi:uncharacterized protein YgbK (DUF1537 family)